MSSLPKESLSSPKAIKKSTNNCLSPWMVDNGVVLSGLAYRPPRAIRWEHRRSDLSGSLPTLNNTEVGIKKPTKTIGTQTPSSCESIGDACQVLSFSQTNRCNRRASDLGPQTTDFHQLGKELRQIADELRIAEKTRSSSTQSLNLGSSPDSGSTYINLASNLLKRKQSIDYLRPRSMSACSSLTDLLIISRKK